MSANYTQNYIMRQTSEQIDLESQLLEHQKQELCSKLMDGNGNEDDDDDAKNYDDNVDASLPHSRALSPSTRFMPVMS